MMMCKPISIQEPLTRDELLDWLREEDEARLSQLWARADAVRAENVGDQVHLRGLVEISNHCRRRCMYCGLRSENRRITRYRMTLGEVLACAHRAVALGYGTLVLQGGEDAELNVEFIADMVHQIKQETGLAVTLSLGERAPEELAAWKSAGADRYLLRFETSDKDLYRMIHPARPGQTLERIELLRSLQRLGYEAGSGIMVGIPGQTYESVADDILLFRELDLDMIGIGPYIPHPHTPLGSGEWRRDIDRADQVPGSERMVYKAIALARLMCPQANIPATTALATINRRNGRELGLMRGANVVMPNLTPPKYRALYEIYPDKACVNETAEECGGCLRRRIQSIGRSVGMGPGGRNRRRVEVS